MQDRERVDRVLRFLETVDSFKKIERATYVSDGTRRENDAEHTWHALLFALTLHRDLSRNIDIGRVLILLTVHDLVEIYAGDTYAYDVEAQHDKSQREQAAADRLFGMLPDDLAETVRSWWDEFEAVQTPEARFATVVDQLQVFAQNVFSQGKVWQERGVTEAMSRTRNQNAIVFDPLVTQVFEMLYLRASEEQLWAAHDPIRTEQRIERHDGVLLDDGTAK